MKDLYRADVIILNVVRFKPSDLDHLHAPEAEQLIAGMRPKLALLTHFGMTMLRARLYMKIMSVDSNNKRG